MVANTIRIKRYSPVGLQRLLDRAVAASQPEMSMAGARRVYVELLRALIGDMRVSDGVIARFEGIEDSAVQTTIRNHWRKVFGILSLASPESSGGTGIVVDGPVHEVPRVQNTGGRRTLKDYRVLLARVHAKEARARQFLAGKTFTLGVQARIRIVFGKPVPLELTSDPVDAIALQTALLIRRVGAERIRSCECLKTFVAVGKRQFCSTACQKRVYMRRFRAGEVGEESDE